jgi:hypothetical protein
MPVVRSRRKHAVAVLDDVAVLLFLDGPDADVRLSSWTRHTRPSSRYVAEHVRALVCR